MRLYIRQKSALRRGQNETDNENNNLTKMKREMKMKEWFYLPAVMLGLVMAGCSSDDLTVGDAGHPQWNENGQGYIALSLNLPQQASATAVRASNSQNDQFDDGEASEYAVKDATLLLFVGKTEKDAVFNAAYQLPLGGFEGVNDDPNQITGTVQLTQAISKIDTSDPSETKIYALVVLNKNNAFTVGDDNKITLAGGGSAFSGDFEDLYSKALTLADATTQVQTLTGNGITMANAPLSNAVGSESYAGTVSTLTEIDPAKIYTTENEAASNPAAEIYVERAVAKVTVEADKSIADGGTLTDKPAVVQENEAGTETAILANGDESTGSNDAQTTLATYTFKGWMLNQTNVKTYLVRNVAAGNDANNSWWKMKNPDVTTTPSTPNSQYRFIGNTPLATGVSLYRTYWGTDPNYDQDPSTGDFKLITSKDWATATNIKAMGASDYCLENTFNVEHMNQDETTQAVVALTFNGGNDFWTLNNSTETVYLSQTNIDNAVKAAYLNTPEVVAALKDGLQDGKSSVSASDLTVTYKKGTGETDAPEAGKWTVTSITINDSRASDFKDNKIPETLAANGDAFKAGVAAADLLNVQCYDGGVAYYPISIKHFGDELTPWTQPASGTDAYDNNNAAKYLGRYGVLRNNWYQLEVSGVSHIGYPEVPVITGQDDPMSRYLSVRINILSWALRKQSVEL